MAFSTELLDAKLAQQKAENEELRQRLLAQALQWLQKNATRYGIQRGYLFGSAIESGRYRSASDLDLAIDSLKDGEPFALMSALSLHINRDVDLVSLDQCHFAEKIRQAGILWIVDA